MKKLIAKITAVITAAVMLVTAAVVPVYAENSAKKIPDTEAMRFVDSLGAGWNLGNAFDSIDCTWLPNTLDYEYGWCGVKTTRDLIKAVKKAGFSAIRIPVSWHNHVDKDLKIDAAWLNRVKEVVDWSLDEGLRVVINIHHDDDDGYYPDSAHLDKSLKYVKSIWSQVAKKFKDYDERLIFNTLNEPNLSQSPYQWWWYDESNPPAEVVDSIKCINKLQQAAVDTIRSVGGKNKTRYLMITGYAARNDERGVLSGYFSLPTDSAKNRLILDCHCYCQDINVGHTIIDKLYKTYVAKGIPVTISEYGLKEEGNNDYASDSADKVKKMGDFFSYARKSGISAFVWDDNGNCRLYDRGAKRWTCPKIVKAMVDGGKPAMSSSTAAKPTVSATAYQTKIKLSWGKLDGAAKYAVYQYKDGKYTKIKTVSGTSATIKSLTSGKTYKFKVRAYINGKWSAYSDVVNATTKK